MYMVLNLYALGKKGCDRVYVTLSVYYKYHAYLFDFDTHTHMLNAHIYCLKRVHPCFFVCLFVSYFNFLKMHSIVFSCNFILSMKFYEVKDVSTCPQIDTHKNLFLFLYFPFLSISFHSILFRLFLYFVLLVCLMNN